MKEFNVIEELKKINVSIRQKMFTLVKTQERKTPPSPLQFRILGYLLNHQEEDICQRDLENELKVSKQTISEVLPTMEKNGVILRCLSKKDARSKNIKLTKMSIERFEEMKEIEREMNEKLIKNIQDEKLRIFIDVLEKMNNNLKD